MSNVILCQGALTKTPYYIKEICINIYSIEELCYYVYHNAHLLDDSFVTVELGTWVEEKLELPKIGKEIRGIVETRNSLGNLVRVLNNNIGYYPENDWRRLLSEIDSNSRLSIAERKKIRADGLLARKRYVLALDEYESVLKEEGIDDSLRARAYHNLGVCAAKMFLFERAADYFEMAYNTYANTESYHEMLCAKKMSMEPKDYLNYLSEHKESYEDSLEIERKMEILKLSWGEQPAYKYLRELEKQRAEGNAYYECIEVLSEEVREDYRGYVNGSW